MRRTPFREYDRFRLAKPIPSEPIPLVTIGVVLMIFDGVRPKYEVEFPDDDGLNLGSCPTFTLSEDFMAPLETSGSDS
jgi:hypothetical protein